MKKLAVTFLALMLSATVAKSAAYSPDVPLICDSFESAMQDWARQTGHNGNIEVMETLLARSGRYVARFQLDKSDRWVAGGPRSELIQPRRLVTWEEGTEIWVGGSVFFPENYRDDPTPEIIWQVHALRRNNSASKQGAVPFLIQSLGPNLVIRGKGFDQLELPRKAGEWTDIVVWHRWSSRGTGSIGVYIDGNRVINARNISNMVRGDRLYWKYGIYKSGWKGDLNARSTVSRREIWFDDIRISSSQRGYDAVVPGDICD